MGLFALFLSACAPVIHGPLVAPFGQPVEAPHRLRIVLFELGGLDIPFHAGIVISAGDERLIYDPVGWWEQRHNDFEREGQVIVSVPRAVEAAYLGRVGIRYSAGSWVTHVFDIAVPAEVAQLAAQKARASHAVPPFQCALATSTLLSELPGFEDIRPGLITGTLYHALLSHPGVTYSRYDLAGVQSG